MEAICTLHTGTFKGTTPSGQAVLSGQVLGYGQIDQLLTSAQDLASHDKANTAGKLTDGNVRAYLAACTPELWNDFLSCVYQWTSPQFPARPNSKQHQGSHFQWDQSYQ